MAADLTDWLLDLQPTEDPVEESVGVLPLVGGEPNDEALIVPSARVQLEAIRLVDQEREGRFLRYRAGTESLQKLLNFLYAECCTRQPVVNISVPAKV